MRQTKIPCKNCDDGRLIWQPGSKRYVCANCGIEEDAVPTWISTANYRKSRSERAKRKRIAYIEEIMGPSTGKIKKKKKSSRDDELEKIWKELVKEGD
ncbi:MAG: hypothetical protein ACTSP4_14385 [Candidatus Hodarchaeales archaeon]